MLLKINSILFVFLSIFQFPCVCTSQVNLRVPTNNAGIFDPDIGPAYVNYILFKEAVFVEVLVEDFRGQIIGNMNFIDLKSGEQTFLWKGLDEKKAKFPDGRYKFSIRVKFRDGTLEEETVETRIASIPKKTKVFPPEPLSFKKYIYRIDGNASTFWTINTEGKNDSLEGGEHCARAHLNFMGKKNSFDGVLSVRRPYPKGDAIYDASHAIMKHFWKEGRVVGVFRQGLGNFDDPIKLFSDFRTEREKVGIRVDQNYDWVSLSTIGLCAEGDTDSEEKGLAGRFTFGPPKEWKFGFNGTKRKAILFNGVNLLSSSAFSGDLCIPVFEGLKILTEYIVTEDTENRRDKGYFFKTEFDSENFRVSCSYFDMGKYFEASYSDPSRHTSSDSHGTEFDFDFIHRQSLLAFKDIAAAGRFFSFVRDSNGERVNEGDITLRFGVGSNNTCFFYWLGRYEEDHRNNSIMGNFDHSWTRDLSSSFNCGYSSSMTSHTIRGMLNTSYRQGPDNYSLAIECIRRVIEMSQGSPYEELGIRLNICKYGWQFFFIARANRRSIDSASNFFGKVSYNYRFLHRYLINCYLSVGSMAAFETERRVETGIEFRF